MFRIKDILNERGLKVKDLAVAVNVAPPNMSKIINGKFQPSLNLLLGIAKALDVEVWELFEGSQKFDKKEEPSINGYVEVGGVIKKINSLNDLEALKKFFEQEVSQQGKLDNSN